MIKFRFSCVLVLVTVVLWAGSASAQITSLTQGLAGCWDLNEDSGTRYDFWNNNDLTDFNTVTANPGLVNSQAAQFTAANSEYLKAADDPSLQFTGDVTVGAWIYNDTIGIRRFIDNDSNVATDPRFDLRMHSTNQYWLRIQDGAGTTVNCTTSDVISTGQWYLVLGWTDFANDKCYVSIDNVAHSTGVIGWPAVSNDKGLWIGAYAAGQYHDGRMGPAYMWTRILTVAEQDWLWNGGAGRGCSEVTGLTADRDYSQDVVDLPNGRRGAIASIVTAGDISIASGILGLLILGIFWVMRDTVRSSKVGDK